MRPKQNFKSRCSNYRSPSLNLTEWSQKCRKKYEEARKKADAAAKKINTSSSKTGGGGKTRSKKPLQKRNPKRTLDADGFQIPPKHLVSKNDKVPLSLPSTPLQIILY
ncbi:hypothetical protein NPIL_394531 [Nephila pilipes]|uniref:Uncharacterized protein n=1 Tax=Nephila pilipes TaxID=299642 RepID=A0A8X6NM60_NEPPI|nr:hypothetical protein NPIL_394531 [Nephila pilipes]